MGRELKVGLLNTGEGSWFGSLDENVILLPLCQTERGNKSWCDYKMRFILISLFSLGWETGCCGSKQSLCGDGGCHGQCVLLWLLWLSWNPPMALMTASGAISGASSI